MSDQKLQTFGHQYCKDTVPLMEAGYLVKVHQKIKEGNKERVQVFQGTVIKVNHGEGINSNFTVRKVSDGIGVEKTYPIHSPNIVKVEVLRAHKVRRAKLKYLRDLSGKALRLKEVSLKLKDWKKPVAKEEKIKVEAEVVPTEEPKAEAKEETK